jgi:hypothetical protein
VRGDAGPVGVLRCYVGATDALSITPGTGQGVNGCIEQKARSRRGPRAGRPGARLADRKIHSIPVNVCLSYFFPNYKDTHLCMHTHPI